MKDAEKLESLRKDYMAALAELGTLSVDRASHLPTETSALNAMRSSHEAEESKKIVAKINRRIAEVCNNMRAVEQRARGEMGIPAVFGIDVPNVIRVAVAILVGKSLAGSWSHECHNVGYFLQPAGGEDPQDLLTVREAFRKGGLLRLHVHCDPGRTLDEMGNLTLTEGAFRRLLALDRDDECEELLKARALVSVAGKR